MKLLLPVYYNGSLAKFFLEMLWEKSLLGYILVILATREMKMISFTTKVGL